MSFLGSLRGPTLEGGAGIGPLTSSPSSEEVFPNVDFLEMDEADRETSEYRGKVLAAAVSIVLAETGLTHEEFLARIGRSYTALARWTHGVPIGETWFERALAALAKVRHGIPVVKN